MRPSVVIACALVSFGCASVRADLQQPAAPSPTVALAELEAEHGPGRFGRVTDRLYRGSQPSEDDLRRLHALGVTKIVDLRRERLHSRSANRETARRLGMQYVEMPFYGVFGADHGFLERVIAELYAEDGGAVYVHCDNGRDRTSLVVALYRVVVDGWTPDLAWQREALAYGHTSKRFNREIELTFRDYVHEHSVRVGTLVAAPARSGDSTR
jgi:protein tyrosine/serine phosphatase